MHGHARHSQISFAGVASPLNGRDMQELLMAKDTSLESTKQLMGALVRMKPKPHEEMNVGKKKNYSGSKG